jgi:hypothetical protein
MKSDCLEEHIISVSTKSIQTPNIGGRKHNTYIHTYTCPLFFFLSLSLFCECVFVCNFILKKRVLILVLMDPTSSEKGAYTHSRTHSRSPSPFREGRSSARRSGRDDRDGHDVDMRDRSRSRSRSPRRRARSQSHSRSRSRSPRRDRGRDRYHRDRSPRRHSRSPPRRRSRSHPRFNGREDTTRREKEWDRQKGRDEERGVERRRGESSAQTQGVDFQEL